jgi:hypothetical protein
VYALPDSGQIILLMLFSGFAVKKEESAELLNVVLLLVT